MQSGSDYRQLVAMCLGEQPAMIFGCIVMGNVAVLCVSLEVQHWLIAPCENLCVTGVWGSNRSCFKQAPLLTLALGPVQAACVKQAVDGSSPPRASGDCIACVFGRPWAGNSCQSPLRVSLFRLLPGCGFPSVGHQPLLAFHGLHVRTPCGARAACRAGSCHPSLSANLSAVWP